MTAFFLVTHFPLPAAHAPLPLAADNWQLKTDNRELATGNWELRLVRVLNHLLRGQGNRWALRAGGVSVGDAHPAKNERRFPPSARGLPARCAGRQAGRPRAFGQSRSLASVAAFFAAAAGKTARVPLSKQASRSCFLKPLAFVRAARLR